MGNAFLTVVNLPPRTEPARKAAILMNKLKHRPKSIVIQSDTEVVIQVRGDFAALVKKLRKTFKSPGKDTSGGALYQHDWKLKGLGTLTAVHNTKNTWNTVRFVNIPGFGIKDEPEPDPNVEMVIPPPAYQTPQGNLDEEVLIY